jgi:hypothetical protein
LHSEKKTCIRLLQYKLLAIAKAANSTSGACITGSPSALCRTTASRPLQINRFGTVGVERPELTLQHSLSARLAAGAASSCTSSCLLPADALQKSVRAALLALILEEASALQHVADHTCKTSEVHEMSAQTFGFMLLLWRLRQLPDLLEDSERSELKCCILREPLSPDGVIHRTCTISKQHDDMASNFQRSCTTMAAQSENMWLTASPRSAVSQHVRKTHTRLGSQHCSGFDSTATELLQCS